VEREQGRKTTQLIRIGFAVIIVLFVAAAAVGVLETQRGQRGTRKIVDNMLVSVELVSRLIQDEQLKQILVNAHIFEKDWDATMQLEQRIAAVDADYKGTAQKYDLLATTPGEPELWRRLQDEVAALDAPIANVLAESRVNNDVQAGKDMRLLDARFAEVDEIGGELVRLNRRHAQEAMTAMRDGQDTGLLILGICTLAGAAVAIVVATWVTRAVGAQQAQLSVVTAELLERNRELDAFAGRVAHDLRAPLASTKLAADQLARRATGDRTVSVVERGVGRMEALIQDLLALTRASATAGRETCDPAAVAHAVEEEAAARIQQEGAAMHVVVQPAAVKCSEGLLHQAFANLVDNALKYRRKDVPVEVAIDGRVTDHVYEVHVRDNGIGMDGEDRRHAFEPFFRSPNVRDRPGTGLGLSIVKRVVEASGGDVEIASAVNRGTDIVIHLPLAAAG
jgi:signal transduction histidine kinase